jgi:retinol dehydrogenase 12
LTTVKPAVETLLTSEDRLDVLWNNAGVMFPPAGSTTAQGLEMQLGSNTVAPFLFTKLLRPILDRTAASAPPDSVRVCWASSLYTELATPKDVINFDDINYTKGGAETKIYAQSKAGTILLASEYAKRTNTGVLHFVSAPPVLIYRI